MAQALAPKIDEIALRARVAGIRNRWPAVGLALGVVSGGRLRFFEGQGLATIESRSPVTEDTIFRIASVTKTFIAVAVMQLVELGLVDLDKPVNHYLRAYKLVPARAEWRQATLRHVLSHSAGIRELRHLWDLRRTRDLGETVPVGRPVPSLAQFYRGGLRVDSEPGTRFMYTNHGFNTLGQLVEDVTGMSLARYLREHVFQPLGMKDTDIERSRLEQSRMATAYELRSHGPRAVGDYEVISRGGGGVSSSPRDMARYVAALLGGGRNENGSILEPAALAEVFAPQYQPDPRLSGIGLAFFRHNLGGHLAVAHDGILPGFDSHICVVPDAGIGVFAFANGARRGMFWLEPHVSGIVRDLLRVPEERIRTDLPQRPELWGELCGRYRLSGPPTDPDKLAFGLGAEVFVRRGQLAMRFLSPIPLLFRGFDLWPDDEADSDLFRMEFPWFSAGTIRVLFSRESGLGVTALHLDMGPLSFQRHRRFTRRGSA